MGPASEHAELITLFFVLGFVIVAVLVLLAVFKVAGGSNQAPNSPHEQDRRRQRSDRNRPLAARELVCKHCGARLDDSTEVSPSGDVKCASCAQWFNVHAD